MVDSGAEGGDELELVAGGRDDALVDLVGDGRHQDVGGLHRLDHLLAREGVVVAVQPRLEQLHHARLHRFRQLARDDYERFFLRHVTQRRFDAPAGARRCRGHADRHH